MVLGPESEAEHCPMALPEDMCPSCSQLEETKIWDCLVDTPDQEGEGLLSGWADNRFRIMVAE